MRAHPWTISTVTGAGVKGFSASRRVRGEPRRVGESRRSVDGEGGLHPCGPFSLLGCLVAHALIPATSATCATLRNQRLAQPKEPCQPAQPCATRRNVAQPKKRCATKETCATTEPAPKSAAPACGRHRTGASARCLLDGGLIGRLPVRVRRRRLRLGRLRRPVCTLDLRRHLVADDRQLLRVARRHRLAQEVKQQV